MTTNTDSNPQTCGAWPLDGLSVIKAFSSNVPCYIPTKFLWQTLNYLSAHLRDYNLLPIDCGNGFHILHPRGFTWLTAKRYLERTTI